MKKFGFVMMGLLVLCSLLLLPFVAMAGELTDQQKVDRFNELLQSAKEDAEQQELLTTLVVISHELKPEAKPMELKFGFGNSKDDLLVINLLKEEGRIARFFGILTIEQYHAGNLSKADYLQREKYFSKVFMMAYMVGNDQIMGEARNIGYALGYIESMECWGAHSWIAGILGHKQPDYSPFYSPSVYRVVTPAGVLKLGNYHAMISDEGSKASAELIRSLAYNK